MLTQARTGRIGLRGFLFQRRVPEVVTPLCDCGIAEETVEHLIRGCPALPEQDLQALVAIGDLQQRIQALREGGRTAIPLLRFIMKRLPMYKVAVVNPVE